MRRILLVAVPCAVTTCTTDSIMVAGLMAATAAALLVRVARDLLNS